MPRIKAVQAGRHDAVAWDTIDGVARAAGTTTRQVRALQTRGLLPHPRLAGRTGLYGPDHLERLRAVLRLQAQGFSLAAIATLVQAWEQGRTVAEVLGLAPAAAGAGEDAATRDAPTRDAPTRDAGESFDGIVVAPWRGRLLTIVPSTVLGVTAPLEEPAAS